MGNVRKDWEEASVPASSVLNMAGEDTRGLAPRALQAVLRILIIRSVGIHSQQGNDRSVFLESCYSGYGVETGLDGE